MRARIWFRVIAVACVLAAASSCSSDSPSDAGSAGQSAAGSSGAAASAGSSGASAGSTNAGSTSAGSAGAAATETERACSSYAEARCQRYRECLPFSFGVTYASLADCEALTARYCPLEVEAAGSSNGASALVACAAARKAQTCGEWLTALPAACNAPGALADGTAANSIRSVRARTASAANEPGAASVRPDRRSADHALRK
jgi:hypothetical protein